MRPAAFLVMFLLFVQFVPFASAVTVEEADDAVAHAGSDLGSAFAAVAEAEAAGADVSTLLAKLDIAGGFLSDAYAALKAGDYENAFSFAVACSGAVDGVAADAARLKLDAEEARAGSFVWALVGSSVGLVLLVVFGLLGWRLLRKWYFKRVLGMRPEVGGVSD